MYANGSATDWVSERIGDHCGALSDLSAMELTLLSLVLLTSDEVVLLGILLLLLLRLCAPGACRSLLLPLSVRRLLLGLLNSIGTPGGGGLLRRLATLSVSGVIITVATAELKGGLTTWGSVDSH